MEKINKGLRRFLIKKKIYGKFCHYYRKYVRTSDSTPICISFLPWSTLPEGYNYWLELYIEWIDEVQKLQPRINIVNVL